MSPGRILLSQTQIRARVSQLGAIITQHYQGQPPAGQRPLFLGIMNGALFFLADLLRAVDLADTEISCVRLASYEGTQSTGRLRGLDVLGESFQGRHILIVDDILDTGHTLAAIVQRLRALGAADVKICVLLQKCRQQEVPIQVDWTGFQIADEFVVGYGLDYDGRYRTLQQIQVLEKPPE